MKMSICVLVFNGYLATQALRQGEVTVGVFSLLATVITSMALCLGIVVYLLDKRQPPAI